MTTITRDIWVSDAKIDALLATAARWQVAVIAKKCPDEGWSVHAEGPKSGVEVLVDRAFSR